MNNDLIQLTNTARDLIARLETYHSKPGTVTPLDDMQAIQDWQRLQQVKAGLSDQQSVLALQVANATTELDEARKDLEAKQRALPKAQADHDEAVRRREINQVSVTVYDDATAALSKADTELRKAERHHRSANNDLNTANNDKKTALSLLRQSEAIERPAAEALREVLDFMGVQTKRGGAL